MSKSFREGFVYWLYEFYSAGKYIHLIAFQMVRIWINEQVVLWIEELMKTSFLWVCVLHFLHFCCPLFCIVPMTSPCHIPHNSSPPAETPSSLPVGLCVLAGWHQAQLAGIRLSWLAGQHATEQVTAGFTPSWPSLLLPCSSPSRRSLPQTSDIWSPVPVLNLIGNGQLKGQLKTLFGWLAVRWCDHVCFSLSGGG